MSTIYIITEELYDTFGDPLPEAEILAAYTNHNSAQADLISLRKNAKENEVYWLEEVELR